jgi:hypothetical protein
MECYTLMFSEFGVPVADQGKRVFSCNLLTSPFLCLKQLSWEQSAKEFLREGHGGLFVEDQKRDNSPIPTHSNFSLTPINIT